MEKLKRIRLKLKVIRVLWKFKEYGKDEKIDKDEMKIVVEVFGRAKVESESDKRSMEELRATERMRKLVRTLRK